MHRNHHDMCWKVLSQWDIQREIGKNLVHLQPSQRGYLDLVYLKMKKKCMGKNKSLRQHQMLVQGPGWFKVTEGGKFGEVGLINPQVSALI